MAVVTEGRQPSMSVKCLKRKSEDDKNLRGRDTGRRLQEITVDYNSEWITTKFLQINFCLVCNADSISLFATDFSTLSKHASDITINVETK